MEILRNFDILENMIATHGNKPVLARREANGQWRRYTVSEYAEQAYALAAALLELGIQKGDKVSTIMQNRPEWNFMDMAIGLAGGIHVPVYPTLSENDYKYILNHCDAKVIVVGVEAIFKRVKPAIPELTLNPTIFTIADIEGQKNYRELLELGRTNLEKWMPTIEENKKTISPEDIGTIIYTSGTTGNPKGVMLRHKSMVINARFVKDINTQDSSVEILSFLPLCHVYERVVNYHYQILGATIYYAGSLATIASDIKDIKADGFCSVPRVMEIMFGKLQDAGKNLKGIKRLIYHWAFRIAQVYDNYNTNWFYVTKYKIADALVYSQWRKNMSGKSMIIVSGGSAIQERIIRTFSAAKMYIYEGYGLTETAPVIAVNRPVSNELYPGTVGPIADCAQFKLADDGEILTKGDCLMVGYYKDPESTTAVIDDEGWFHTGDIGTLVNGRYLKITDRKKEIFKLSTGKFVSPQVLENKLKESSFIEQAFVIGEHEKIAAAIISPNLNKVRQWCKKHRIDCSSDSDLIANDKVTKRIKKEIAKINENLAEHEQIRQFRLVADTWTQQTGELSQTLKLRRSFLYKKYDHLCKDIYPNRKDDTV